MSGLKRTAIEDLRRGAPKGKRVLWIWDRAGIDFRQLVPLETGQRASTSSATPRRTLRPETLCEHPWDRADAVNNGVVSDREVSTSQGVSVRQVIYTDPATGRGFTFITNLPRSDPTRRDRPALPDALGCGESFRRTQEQARREKGWASSPNAKAMQASFLCMAHNLIEVESLQAGEGARREKTSPNTNGKRSGWQRRERRPSSRFQKLYVRLQRLTQHSVKLIRWI